MMCSSEMVNGETSHDGQGAVHRFETLSGYSLEELGDKPGNTGIWADDHLGERG